jgi:hypothetical protein
VKDAGVREKKLKGNLIDIVKHLLRKW